MRWSKKKAELPTNMFSIHCLSVLIACIDLTIGLEDSQISQNGYMDKTDASPIYNTPRSFDDYYLQSESSQNDLTITGLNARNSSSEKSPTFKSFASTKIDATIIDPVYSQPTKRDCVILLQQCLQCLNDTNNASLCGTICDAYHHNGCDHSKSNQTRSLRQSFGNYSKGKLNQGLHRKNTDPIGSNNEPYGSNAESESIAISDNMFAAGLICLMISIVSIPLAISFKYQNV